MYLSSCVDLVPRKWQSIGPSMSPCRLSLGSQCQVTLANPNLARQDIPKLGEATGTVERTRQFAFGSVTASALNSRGTLALLAIVTKNLTPQGLQKTVSILRFTIGTNPIFPEICNLFTITHIGVGLIC